MILILDNFDSFTYNLVDYLEQAGVSTQVFRNNVSLDEIQNLKFDGIILSPGPGTPKESGIMLELIDKYHSNLPILGICLGHQALGEYYGAKLIKAQRPMHGKVSSITKIEDPIFENIPTTFNVVRYHSLILSDIPNQLKVLAKTNFDEIMMFKHLIFNSYGIQFHPEAYLTEYGLQLIKNWIKIGPSL